MSLELLSPGFLLSRDLLTITATSEQKGEMSKLPFNTGHLNKGKNNTRSCSHGLSLFSPQISFCAQIPSSEEKKIVGVICCNPQCLSFDNSTGQRTKTLKVGICSGSCWESITALLTTANTQREVQRKWIFLS